jgi:ribosomal protein S18 acetylase RimI-like enzyme
MINIEPVETPDAVARVAALAETIWREHFTPIIGADQVAYMLDRFQSAEAIAAQLDEGVHYFLLVDESAPVGYMALIPETDRLMISKLYILAEHRGRGVGRAAVAMAQAEARCRGLPVVYLTVNRFNHASIAAYRRLGFAIAGEVKKDIGGGFVMDDYQMEMRAE